MKILKTGIQIIIISFILNLIWEVSHAPLFYWFIGYKSHLLMCLYPSVWDAFLVLSIYFIISLLSRNFDWIKNIKKKELFYIIILWLIIAIIFEKYALITWRWAYNENMPIIPLLWIWLTPTLQMIIIPYLTFWFAWRFFKKSKN